jgi:nucleoside 2-deoxyribosyltransferase
MIYIAAPFIKKYEARQVRQELRMAGFDTCSAWLDQPDEPYEVASNISRAMRDVEEVESCSVFLFLNLAMSEGKATELGMALMLGKPIFCIGGKERNVFLHLPQITHVLDVTEFIAAINLL